MRIRKYAAKLLLGFGCSHDSPPPPPLATYNTSVTDTETDTDTEGLYLFQLNCSPWDVINHFRFEGLQEEDRGIMGNELGFGDDDNNILGLSHETNTGKVKKIRRRKKKRRK